MLHLKSFKKDDIEELSRIMKDAFDEDSMIHLKKKGGPDGYDDGSFVKKWFMHEGVTAYTALDDDRVIGGACLWINENNENFLGCIFIDPEYENKGIGTRLWKKFEDLFPNTKVWRTETPIFSHRNHNFYINKCGFKCVKITDPRNLEGGMFQLEKIMK